MTIEVRIPKEDQLLEEATLVSWKIKEGDSVRKGETLAEIETPKAIVELASPAEGIVSRIFVKDGDVFPVNGPLAVIEAAGEAGAQPTAPAGAAAETPKIAAAPGAAGEGPVRILATPAARRLAREKGIDLGRVRGSGPGGRILESDLPACAGPGAKAGESQVTAAAEERSLPLSPLRRAIASRLALSKKTIPHFYLTTEVDAGPLWDAYCRQKTRGEVSLNDYVIEAAAAALRDFPAVNSRLEADCQVFRSEVNIGIAVHMGDGLCVPVLRGADRLSLMEISQRTAELVRQAREGRVEGVGTGTFTITNLGMFDVTEFAAVINPPEVAILAVGKVREAAVVRNGVISAGRTLSLTLSCDHRALDGVTGAAFLRRVKELLEAPRAQAPAG